MTHRPYPNAARALRHIQYKRAVYLYGRCPQRYVMAMDPPPDALVTHIRLNAPAALARAAETVNALRYRT